jgi:hypothetical protein
MATAPHQVAVDMALLEEDMDQEVATEDHHLGEGWA